MKQVAIVKNGELIKLHLKDIVKTEVQLTELNNKKLIEIEQHEQMIDALHEEISRTKRTIEKNRQQLNKKILEEL
jgi:hypothetical protein